MECDSPQTFPSPDGTADLRIHVQAKPEWLEACASGPETLCYVSPENQAGGKPALTVTQLAGVGGFRLDYADGTRFVVDRQATRLWAAWPVTLTLENAATYLLGPVMGFVLRLRGLTSLHASAVALGAEAMALMGPPGAWKSTAAAAFALRGCAVLCDDVCALEEQGEGCVVRPAYPRLCLRPDSAQALCGTAETLPRLVPGWEKRYLPLDGQGHRFQPTPLLLGAIYLLGERSSEAAAPRVEAIPPGEALIELVKNTYMNYLLDRAPRAREFERLGRLLERVPLRRVTPRADPRALPELCEAIAEDLASLRPLVFAATRARPDTHVHDR